MVRWLSERVGQAGHVVAADLDSRFLGDLRAPNVEVRRCDITQDEFEPASYDLVHSRAVVVHMNDPADVLRRMVAALRPGGWLIAEDPITARLSRLTPPIRWLRPSTPASTQESSFSRRRTSWTSGMAGCCRFTWNRSDSSSWETRPAPWWTTAIARSRASGPDLAAHRRRHDR